MDEVTPLAREILDAYAAPRAIAVPPTARDGGLDLSTAYRVEAAIAEMRAAEGHRPVGLKVGYANKAVWRALKLDTLVWARMYDDTVELTGDSTASVDLAPLFAPKIEPEIVVKLKGPVVGGADAATVLAATEWIALGFEIIDCLFPDWKVQPADFVASKGLHARLVVGTPLAIEPEAIPALVDQLAAFKVTLLRNGEMVAEGSGRNSLRSPALCIAELSAALGRQPGASPLDAGDVISSGTLTESQLMAAAETWTATVEGIALPDLTVRTSGSPAGA